MGRFLTKYFYVTWVIILGVGIIVGIAYRPDSLKDKQSALIENIHPVRENDAKYGFINPLLFYDLPNNISATEYQPLASKLQRIVDKYSSARNPAFISIYYREPNQGRWVGINENEKFIPASLMKVGVMIAYFKIAETNPAVLSEKIKYSRDLQNIDASIPNAQSTELVPNQYYPVSTLIEKMITRSDNGATFALLNHPGNSQVLDEEFSELGMQNPAKIGTQYTISVSDYTRFFRILYNATYLNRAMSERALKLLSMTNFKDGLTAGLPTSMVVAHKYGEAVISSDEKWVSSVELHDCGIIYYPQKPYMLCVMTKGPDINQLKSIISEISATVYTEVSKNR